MPFCLVIIINLKIWSFNLIEFIGRTGIVITVIFSLLTLIYLLILFILLIRIFEQYRSAREKIFVTNWEKKIFEYLNKDQNPHDLIKLFPRSTYKYLLNNLRGYLLMLKGDDKEKIQRLVNETPVYDYLLKKIKSFRSKNLIFGVYYLGLAESENSRFIIRKKLKTRNELVFLTCSLSLARMNDIDSINSIFNEAAKFKNLGNDTLQSILLEFDESCCLHLLMRLDSEKSPKIKSVIIAVLRHFKFEPAAPDILSFLFNEESSLVIMEALKYFSKIKYAGALAAVRFYLNNSKPELRAEAIKAALKINDPSLEERVWSLIYNNDRSVKVTAAETSYYFSDSSREKLKQLAYTVPNTLESSIARMIISQKTIHLN